MVPWTENGFNTPMVNNRKFNYFFKTYKKINSLKILNLHKEVTVII